MTLARCIDGALELPQPSDREQPVESPCLALGMAVLYRAWIDALDGRDYLEAGCGSREWWTRPSRALYRWCAALGLDVSWVVRRARQRLREYDAGSTEVRRRIRGTCDFDDRQLNDYEAPDPMAAERQRKRRERGVTADKAARMEARFPGYAARHPRIGPRSQAES